MSLLRAARSDLPAEGKEQARKVLVLYDQEAATFFLGSWAQWRRVSKLSGPAAVGVAFDCDDDSQVRGWRLAAAAAAFHA